MLRLVITAAIGGLSWLLWLAVRNFFTSSPLDKIPGPESPSWVKGNMGQLFDRHSWGFVDQLGTKYNKVVRLTGLFGHRMLYVFDPTALHQVVIKEGEIYDIPEWSLDQVKMCFGPGLLGVHGDHHRRQRKMLNPVFSIKHMRSMTPLFYDVAHRLRTGLMTEVKGSPTTVDVLSWFGRTALELIGQGGLGYSLDNLTTPARNEYGEAIKKFLPFLAQNGVFQPLLKYLKHIGPPTLRSSLMNWLPMPELKRLKDVVETMDTEANHIYQHKKNALEAGEESVVRQVGEGKDIMSILLRANREASEEDRLPENEVIAQMSLLVMAGTDTTSNSLTQIMQLLAEKPDIQDKLRAEILQAQEDHGEDIPYDTLVALPYMDAICRETLRLYPPVSYLFREAQKDIVMPLSEPIHCSDGTTMREIPVPAGTTVLVAIRPSNLNKEIWGDDVLDFKPERWLAPLPATVTDARIPGVYSNLLTFNGGGRACIGFKFSQLEMKVVLATLLSSFKVSPAKNAKDVVWNMAGVRYPTVGKDSLQPSFPLTMEALKA